MREVSAYPRGSQNCDALYFTSKGHDSKYDKFPTREIYNLG